MQIAVNQLRMSPSLGMHSSGLLGDVRPGKFGCLPQKEASRNAGAVNVRACVGPPPNAPLSSSGATSVDTDKELPNRPTAPTADSDKKFTRPPPFSGFSGSLGLNFPGNQIPGLPGSPRPKPGTPRPYDPTKQKSKVMEWLTPPKPPTELLQREHFKLSDTCACTIYFGDLSKWFVDGKSDAVIAPSNKKLNTGPAVNAVLFKAAGSKLLECTQRLPDVAPQGIKAEMGDAISTRAFDLPVHRIIHTVGAVYKKNEKTGVRDSDPILEKAYKTALMVARYEQLKYLAFPPLSCNIYGYPYADGAEVALRTLKANCDGFERIDIVIRNIEGYEAFIDEANKVLQVVKEKKTIKVPAMAPRTGDNLPPAAAAASAAASIDPAQAPSATAGITEADSRPQALFSTAEPPSPATPTYSQAQAVQKLDRDSVRKMESAAQTPPANGEADSSSEASTGTAQSQSPLTPTFSQAQAPSFSQAPSGYSGTAQGPSGYSSRQYQNAPAQYPNAPPTGQYQSPYQNAPSYQQQQRYNHNAPPQYQRQPPQYNQQYQNPQQYRTDPSQQYGNPPYQQQQQYGNIPPQQQYGNVPRYQQQQQQHGNYPPQQQYGNIPPQQEYRNMQYGNPPAQQQHQYGTGNAPGESPTSTQVPPQHQHEYGRPPPPPQYGNFPPQQAPPPQQQQQQQQAYGNPSPQYTPPPRPDNPQPPF